MHLGVEFNVFLDGQVILKFERIPVEELVDDFILNRLCEISLFQHLILYHHVDGVPLELLNLSKLLRIIIFEYLGAIFNEVFSSAFKVRTTRLALLIKVGFALYMNLSQ